MDPLDDGPVAEELPKECKGKSAARILAKMVIRTDNRRSWSSVELPTSDDFREAREALKPFGYPDIDMLKRKLNL